MLPSQAGSAPTGNGSSSGRGNTGESSAVIGGGIRPGLVRTGLTATVVGDSLAGVGRPGDGSGMLGGNGTGMGSRSGARPGNGAGLTTLQGTGQGSIPCMNAGLGASGGRFDPDRENLPQAYSGSDADSDSGDDDDPVGSVGDSRRGVKRERAEMDAAVVGQEAGVQPGGYGVVSGVVAGAKPGKKTRGRVKIKMEFIDNKLRRYTTFSKRKTGIMKKAYELSTLTGTQVLLLVASETGHVYTFATRKLQPMITSETGKALIQTCLNSPDSPPRSDPSTDQRMSATGFEETDLTYQVSESDSCGETKDTLKPAFTVTSLPGTTSASATSTTMQVSSATSFPITNYLAPVSASTNSISSANGTVLKTSGSTGSVMQLPSGFTFMPGAGVPQQLQAIQVPLPPQQGSINSSDSSTEASQSSSSSTVSVPATIVTSSVPTSMGGHMMYPSPHTVMYASTPTLADGSLAVLNAFSQAPTAMQVSHTQGQDAGAVPQVFLTAPPGAVQIPVSAVQLHPMVIGQQSAGGSSSNLTELQVVNLDSAHTTKGD
ncbi:serum response factor-like isoform X2 [Anguilla anguilla]|uniref:serum response factor-like isoform X2 n=1 Tax=Anguilla anguilla TaxID=7936 RepID=UPI0015AFD0A8|nr:serum response factor-like isoform X2 [Anguilla anguilla]